MKNPLHNDKRIARSEAAEFRARRDSARARQDILEGLEPLPRPSIYGPMGASLTGLLLEDAALAQRRPGSWEGANLATVLEAHGYTL